LRLYQLIERASDCIRIIIYSEGVLEQSESIPDKNEGKS